MIFIDSFWEGFKRGLKMWTFSWLFPKKKPVSITEWSKNMCENGGFDEEDGNISACNPNWLKPGTHEVDPEILEHLINGLGKKVE